MSQVEDFNTGIIEEFRSNHGVVGGPFEGAPLVLLTTTGAKSGTRRTHPLAALAEDGRLYVFASKGGAPTNPDWYHNVVAHPEVEVEYGDEKFPAVAHVVTGAERDRLYEAQVARMPGFGEYQERTGGRVIPVVELRRTS
jgi:deazaflavin-dependent oxidoreductase (nitroreductase family)